MTRLFAPGLLLLLLLLAHHCSLQEVLRSSEYTHILQAVVEGSAFYESVLESGIGRAI